MQQTISFPMSVCRVSWSRLLPPSSNNNTLSLVLGPRQLSCSLPISIGWNIGCLEIENENSSLHSWCNDAWFWWAGSACVHAQLCLTLCDPMDYCPPDSSVHGISHAKIMEWAAITFSRGSSQPRDWTQVFRIAGRCFTVWATREALPFNYHLLIRAHNVFNDKEPITTLTVTTYYESSFVRELDILYLI